MWQAGWVRGEARLGNIGPEGRRQAWGHLGMAPRRSYRLRVDPSPRAGIRHQRTQHRMVELMAASHGAVRGEQGAARKRQIADRVQDLVADEFVGETLAFRIEDAVVADDERVLERGAERITRVPQRGHVAHETEGT